LRWAELEVEAEREVPQGNRARAVTAESEKKAAAKAALGEPANWGSTKTRGRRNKRSG
jgi:hypothetical protein